MAMFGGLHGAAGSCPALSVQQGLPSKAKLELLNQKSSDLNAWILLPTTTVQAGLPCRAAS